MRLTWPPSINHYWRMARGRMFISRAGRAYRETVRDEIPQSFKPIPGRLAVSIIAFPPDCRRRDIDNIIKPLLDALQHAGVYEDDEQIDQISIHRGPLFRPGGQVEVFINSIHERLETPLPKTLEVPAEATYHPPRAH